MRLLHVLPYWSVLLSSVRPDEDDARREYARAARGVELVGHDQRVIFWLTVGGSVLFGFLVGRWRALLAPPLLSLIVFIKAAEDRDNPFAPLVFVWGAFLAIGVVIGVLLRKRRSTPSDHSWYPPS